MYTNQKIEHVYTLYIGIISPLQGIEMCWGFMGQKTQVDTQPDAGFRRMLGKHQFGATR